MTGLECAPEASEDEEKDGEVSSCRKLIGILTCAWQPS